MKRLRARNQSGWLVKTKTAEYQANWNEYIMDATSGKKKRVHRTKILGPINKMTKVAALRKMREIVYPLNDHNAAKQDGSVTLSWFADNKFVPARKGGWTVSTINSHEEDFRLYIKPGIGNMALRDIDIVVLQQFLDNLANERELSYWTVLRCKTMVSSILEFAMELAFIVRNPARSKFFKMPICKPAKKPVLSREEMIAFWNKLTDVRDHLIMVFGSTCGVRSGELFGLVWDCIQENKVEIRSKAYRGRLYEGRTKSEASKRNVPIPAGIYREFMRWKVLCGDPKPEDLVFPSSTTGRAMWPAVFLQKRIQPLAREIGIKSPVTFQVLRRSFATWNQKSLKAAQGVLGHSSIDVTANVYAQEVPEDMAHLVDAYYKSITSAKPKLAGRVQ
jgi:integrase